MAPLTAEAPRGGRGGRGPASAGGLHHSSGDPVLHPGRATVRFELHDAYVGTTLTETTRTVRIPR
ncbi:hypothetical protein [Micromonospora sp. NBC_00617]|uniref:hypothetical protein n=1 Tax=Micromonospora sp. NBC_00617 TaxID=2903587 RepID=UPI0030E0D04B